MSKFIDNIKGFGNICYQGAANIYNTSAQKYHAMGGKVSAFADRKLSLKGAELAKTIFKILPLTTLMLVLPTSIVLATFVITVLTTMYKGPFVGTGYHTLTNAFGWTFALKALGNCFFCTPQMRVVTVATYLSLSVFSFSASYFSPRINAVVSYFQQAQEAQAKIRGH